MKTKHYTHLNYENMIAIEILLKENLKPPEIAKRLGKNKTTIYRCIKSNQNQNKVFQAKEAYEKSQKRKSISNSHPRIIINSNLEQFILSKIESYWSPEQIANRWKLETGEKLSHETIYKYIYMQKPDMIKKYLRRKGKKYQRSRKEKYQIKDRRMIDERPKSIKNRKKPGHWEGDTIVGKDHQQGIVTNVERKSGFLLASKVPAKTAENTANAIIKDFAKIPEKLRKSLTFDNGREFANHKIIEQELKIIIYFAHPYSSWERGTNENTNGLLRQFIPKKTDFSKVSEEDLMKFVDLINNRPRKRLNYKTPNEVFQEIILKSCT